MYVYMIYGIIYVYLFMFSKLVLHHLRQKTRMNPKTSKNIRDILML